MPGKDRQRQLAREKIERQMAKRAAEAQRRRRRQAIAGSVAAVVAIVALAGFATAKVGDHKKKKAPAAAAQAVATPRPQPTPTVAPKPKGCAYPASPASAGAVPRKVKAPSVKNVVKTGTVNVVMTTNQGVLTLTLNRAKAPCTVNSFVSLLKQKYFDKTPCHRLTTSGLFVLQCGDPGGTGSGGPGYTFAEEGLPTGGASSVSYPTGTLAMANAGAGTTGSQFFIVYKDSALPPNYTMFGTVTKGLDVVTKVAAKGSTPAGDGKPNAAVTIQSVTLAS